MPTSSFRDQPCEILDRSRHDTWLFGVMSGEPWPNQRPLVPRSRFQMREELSKEVAGPDAWLSWSKSGALSLLNVVFSARVCR